MKEKQMCHKNCQNIPSFSVECLLPSPERLNLSQKISLRSFEVSDYFSLFALPFSVGINRTALREIKLLQELSHPNIIGVSMIEVVSGIWDPPCLF